MNLNLQTARIQPLLIFIGIPHHKVYRSKNRPKPTGTFWVRNEAKLDFILHDAHRAYRAAMKVCHPDLKNGSAKRATNLNQAWQRVKKLFAQRGVKL